MSDPTAPVPEPNDDIEDDLDDTDEDDDAELSDEDSAEPGEPVSKNRRPERDDPRRTP